MGHPLHDEKEDDDEQSLPLSPFYRCTYTSWLPTVASITSTPKVFSKHYRRTHVQNNNQTNGEKKRCTTLPTYTISVCFYSRDCTCELVRYRSPSSRKKNNRTHTIVRLSIHPLDDLNMSFTYTVYRALMTTFRNF